MLDILLLLACLPAFAADDPLLKAAQNCEVEELKKMFDSGESHFESDRLGLPLDPVDRRGPSAKTRPGTKRLTLALERGLSLKARDRYAKTPLVHLVMEPSKTAMINFSSRGPTSTPRFFKAAIFHAVLHGAVNNVRTLILRGARSRRRERLEGDPAGLGQKHNQEGDRRHPDGGDGRQNAVSRAEGVAHKAVSLAPQPAPAAAPRAR